MHVRNLNSACRQTNSRFLFPISDKVSYVPRQSRCLYSDAVLPSEPKARTLDSFFSTFFFSKFFFKNFFPKTFFSKFFQNYFQISCFEGFTLDASSFTETKRTLCICVMKNMIYSKRSKLDFSLV